LSDEKTENGKTEGEIKVNFTCDRTLLLDAFMTASRSIPQKTSVPVLSCFLIEASMNGEIVITGFDLDLGITTKVEGDVKMHGKIAIDAKIVLEILRSMDMGNVSFITCENNTVNVSCGSSEFTINYVDGSTYPERPLIEGFEYITMDQRVLHSIIRQTVFAVSANDMKGIYTGANFKFSNGILEVVATDTYRFAMRREKFDTENEFSIIIQGRVLSELIKIMKNEEGPVRIGYNKKQVLFEFENTKVVSRLVEGEYMDYGKIMPKSFKYQITVGVKDFKRIIEKASVLINDKQKAPIRLSLEKERIYITCHTTDGHSFEDEISAEIGGEFMEIGLNNRNLLDILTAVECDNIKMCLNSSLSSVSFVPENGDGFLYLVAPMRLGKS